MHGDLPHVLRVPDVPDAWTVLQDVVPLAEQGGHLMIMPNRHWISLATVDDQEGLAATTDRVISGLRTFFSHPIFFFEHGPGFIECEQIACGGCHMDHGHGHLLLLPEEMTLDPIQTRVEQILALCSWTDIPNKRVESSTIFAQNHQTAGINPYVHMGMITDNGTRSLTYIQRSTEEGVESQLLRRVIADVVYRHPEREYWHWRDIISNSSGTERIKKIQLDVTMFRDQTGY